MIRAILLTLAIATLAGCSSERLYNFGQSLGRSHADCEALTSMPERARCEASFADDFAAYQTKRDEHR